MPNDVEHVNFWVEDADQTARFLITAMPDWRVRHRVARPDGYWLHVGTDETYLALSSPTGDKQPSLPKGQLNHVGFVVDDIEAVRRRLLAAGYRGGHNNGKIDEHPYRRRVYFLDAGGIEYEFVEYLSDKPECRNSYNDD